MAKKGGKRRKAELLYEDEVYTPDGAKSLLDKDLRKEYSRLRSIARKRLQRFEGTEWEDSQIFQQNEHKFKPLKEISNERELRHLFSDVARFVTTETASVSGLEKQRRLALESLNEHGYDFVDHNNFKKFVNFMEFARAANINRMYDSDRLADFFQENERKFRSNTQMKIAFITWMKNQQQQPKIQNFNPRTSDKYRHDIEPLEQPKKKKGK
jgi:hypothetical protein